jgi:DNA-binding beta-propeller fold protein YncE
VQLVLGRQDPAPMTGPRGVACTADGNRLWVADTGGHCVHLFDLQRQRYRRFDKLGQHRLLSPVHVSVGRSDSVYICDSEANEVIEIKDDDGAVIRVISMPTVLGRVAACWEDAANGLLYVVDIGRHDIKVISPAGELVRTLCSRGTAPGRLNFPVDIAGRHGNLWVSDAGNQRIQSIDLRGAPVRTIGKTGDAPGDFALPKGLAFDQAGNLYVVDARFENVQVLDPANGTPLLFFGEEGRGPGEFWLPAGIHIDSRERIWVCDSYNRRVQAFLIGSGEGDEADAGK